MDFKSVQQWIDAMAIRVVRQGQRNYFVGKDVAASINEPSLRPGQYQLRTDNFARLPVGGEALDCLTASGLQKLYALTEGKLDIDGGIPLVTLNSADIANVQADYIEQTEPPRDFDSPIQEALLPYLPCLIGPNNAVLVTPELAKTLLGGNLKNRPRSNRNFKRLCSQLRAGKWKVNGATISFSRNWLLLDGQHRLFAIVETGIPALCIIGFGFDPAVFATLDQGAKRTNADNLAIAGFASPRLLAGAIGVYQAAKNGAVVNNTARAIEPEECVRLAQATPHLQTAVKKARDYHRRGARFVSDSLIGGLMARGMEIDKRTTTRFFDYLLNDNCKGVRPTVIQKLRTQLLRDYMDKSRSPNASFTAAVIIKVWNAYRQGQSLRCLKYTPETVIDGVSSGEPYPIMA